MKFVFVSNYFNHHQKPFCDAMYALAKGSFCFVATSQMRDERKAMGYQMENIPDYVKCSYTNDETKAECQRIIDEADVVISGGVPHEILKNRIKIGKLLLRYQERPFKEKKNILFLALLSLAWHFQNPKNKPIYLLCAGAYTAADYKKIGLFKNKTYKWGYFPETKIYDMNELFSQKDTRKLIWCGRFLDWKQPETAVEIAKRLCDDGYEFTLDMIGSGERFEAVEKLIEEYNLQKYVNLLGNKTPVQVRSAMETAGIYLFTSNRKEGWGAVLNESMNSACAVVACNSIGSVPYLLQDGENGFVFDDNDIEKAYRCVKKLMDDADLQKKFGKKAYESIVNTWNAKIAAQRLNDLADNLLSRNEYYGCENGPCSRT